VKLKEKWGNLFDGYPINSLCDLYRFEAETCRNGPRRYCGKYRWQLRLKGKDQFSTLRWIRMVKCPECGKENIHPDKELENQIFKISAYTCLNCGTQFKSQG